jgi:hypothetical protein
MHNEVRELLYVYQERREDTTRRTTRREERPFGEERSL